MRATRPICHEHHERNIFSRHGRMGNAAGLLRRIKPDIPFRSGCVRHRAERKVRPVFQFGAGRSEIFVGGAMVWCNPPYSNIIEWCRKATEEQQNGTTTVMLVPARTDTKWFHQYVWQKPDVSIQFVRGRLRFGGSNQNAPFPSMVIVFRGKTDGTETEH